MRVKDDEEGKGVLFYINIYIIYIIIIPPSSFSPLSFPSSSYVHVCSAEDAPQGRKGERWWKRKIGCCEREWLLGEEEVVEEVVEVVVGSGCGSGCW